jgi:predicted nuclease of restriction endonuclease-like RecB superfamily
VPDAGVIALPSSRLPYLVADGEIVPSWLSDRDRPWLRDLLDDAQRFVGRPFAAWQRHARRSELDPRAGRRQHVALHVLARWLQRASAPPPHRELRSELFALVGNGMTRDGALAVIATRLATTPDALVATLYDDLPKRRRLVWPDHPPEPGRLLLAANSALVAGLLRFALRAELLVHGASRLVLKTAWLRGFVPELNQAADGAMRLTWAVGKQPGSAHDLAALATLLPWTRRFRLTADIALPHAHGRFVLATGDPILPAPEPRPFDSRLEERFARDFGRDMPDWRILREPAPVAIGTSLAFPDFELAPPTGPTWLCEIAGLRDRSALSTKLALLRCERLVLCLPERAIPTDLRAHSRVVGFRRYVDVRRVREVVNNQ